MKKIENAGKVFRTTQIEEYKNDRVSLSETDIENTAAKKDIDVMDINALKKLLNSDNIIEDYNKYCEESAKRIVQLNDDKTLQFMRYLKEVNSEKVLIKLLKEDGYQEFTEDQKEELKKYIQIKIDYYNHVIDVYIKMLQHNYKSLKLTDAQAKKMSSDLKAGKNVGKHADTIIQKLEDNRKIWEKPWGADFTKLGGGRVFVNKNENIWEIGNNARTIFNMSTSWDVIIYCHGTNMTPAKQLSKEEQEFVEKIQKLLPNSKKYTKQELDSIKEQLTPTDKSIIQKYSKDISKLMTYYDIDNNADRYISLAKYVKDRLTGKLKKGWGFGHPLPTPYGTYRDVNELLRVLIENGVKSIKILSCNPGHYDLDPDLQKLKGVKIDYQNYSVLMENAEDVITESINLQSIKDKINKILDDMKSKSSTVFKGMIDRFKSFDIPFISVKGKKPEVESKKVSSKSEVAKAFETSNKSIVNEINTIQNNITLLKEAKEMLSKKPQNESLDNILVEAYKYLSD